MIRLLARLACVFGFHRWGEWKDSGIGDWELDERACSRPGCDEFQFRMERL